MPVKRSDGGGGESGGGVGDADGGGEVGGGRGGEVGGGGEGVQVAAQTSAPVVVLEGNAGSNALNAFMKLVAVLEYHALSEAVRRASISSIV